MRCPACGSSEAAELEELGQLGPVYWWRCVACGMDYQEDPEVEHNSGFRVFEAPDFEEKW